MAGGFTLPGIILCNTHIYHRCKFYCMSCLDASCYFISGGINVWVSFKGKQVPKNKDINQRCSSP